MLRISSLQWAVGGFCTVIGALMVVAPFQFHSPAYTGLRPQLVWLGPGLLLAGGALFAAGTLAPRIRIVFLVHLWASGMLLFLATRFAQNGVLSGVASYLVLGVGVLLAPLLSRPRTPLFWLHGDAFPFVIGFGTALNGLLWLVVPERFWAPSYFLIQPDLVWYGLAFIVSGGLLCLSHVRGLVPVGLGRWAPVLVGGVLFSFGVSATVSTNAWTGVAYYLGFGALLTFIASMGPRLRRIDPSSLRTRLALVLAAGVAVPLLVLVALYAKVEEREERSNVLAHQQALVTALAQDVDDYISLHEAALKLLVGLPGLLTLSPAEQHAILVNSKTAYPDVVGFGTVAADGQPIARADSLTGISWSGDAVFEGARRTKQPALDVRISPIIHHPIFTIGVPILDVDGRFPGMVSSSLESSRIAAFLTRIDLGIDAQTYLVDPPGRVIAHPDVGLVADFADLSATPTVNAFLNDPAPSGSLQVPMRGSVVLASYARVPGLGLGVIVERPAALAMATTYAKLNVLFVGLLVAIGAAAGFGAFAAEWLSRPLATLGAVVDGLATGDDGSPLPTATLTEVTTLTDAFSAMRERVIGRTAELLASNRELEALYRVGQTITAPLQLDTVLNTIARCTAELLGTDAGAILIVDRATQTLSVQGAYGISDRAVRDTRDRVGESIAGRVVETGQPMVANDVPNNPLFVNPEQIKKDCWRLPACHSPSETRRSVLWMP